MVIFLTITVIGRPRWVGPAPHLVAVTSQLARGGYPLMRWIAAS